MMKRVMQNTDPLLGRPVGSLQTMLRLLSQGDSAIAPVAPDGIFGRCTLRSVTDFQRAFSLPSPGRWTTPSGAPLSPPMTRPGSGRTPPRRC
ncbi:MAG: peptidoglycan-binding protein [Oscillospiraceae bacterium]